MEQNWLRQLREHLWGEREALTRYQLQLRQVGRFSYALARDLVDGQISLRAMSLIYTTLLSLVPLLALSFSVLKGLGVHNSLQPVLERFLAPLGAQGGEISRNVIAFVENIKVGLLGFVGVLLLLYTVLSMIQKVEDSFNYIWRVDTRRQLGQRISEYLSVLLIGPAAVFFALGITAGAMNSAVVARLAEVEPFGLLVYVIGRLIPYAVIVGLFTFLYAFVPNTRVRPRAAFGGGLLAGLLWQSASVGFASFVAVSPSYGAIYSSFAIIILLLIWLYVGWMILLVGCQVSYYLQYPERLTPTRTAPLISGRGAELLGLWITGIVGRRFLAGQPPLTREELHRQVLAIPEHVDRTLDVLVHHGVLVEAGAEGEQLLPGRDLDSLTVAQLWQLLREGFDVRPRARDGLANEVHTLLESAESAFAAGDGRKTLREWLATAPAAASDAATRPL